MLSYESTNTMSILTGQVRIIWPIRPIIPVLINAVSGGVYASPSLCGSRYVQTDIIDDRSALISLQSGFFDSRDMGHNAVHGIRVSHSNPYSLGYD